MEIPKIKLVFCTDGIFPHAIGGMERHSRLLVEELAKNPQLEITVIHPHTGKRIFENQNSVQEVVISIKRGKYLISYVVNAFRYSRKVYEHLKSHPDAVIYSQGMAVWHGIKKISNRVILNPHGLEPYQVLTIKEKIITLPYKLIHDYLFRHAGKIISLGGRLTNVLISRCNIPDYKIAVIPNAVNLPKEKVQRRFDSVQLQLLFVGRFAFNKGIQFLAEAAHELNLQGYKDRLRFIFAGKGPMFDELNNRYKAENILFYGGASDEMLKQLYTESGLFILPTLFEGMPTVVLEAMSYGLPVMVTDTGATREMVDETNGYIIEKKSIASIKNAILKFVELSPEQKKGMSDASFLKVRENFTWSIVAQKHIRLFNSIIESA